ERLKLLRPSHLRVDLRLSAPSCVTDLERAAGQARQPNTGVYIALTLSNQAERELHSLAAELKRLRPRVVLWLVFHEGEQAVQEKWLRLAQSILSDYAPHVPMAGGTREFFTELNRNRPAAEAAFLPCYPVNPQ